jgi:hypothetical protein
MKIDIYNSCTVGNKYLSVPASTNLETLQPPSDFDEDMLRLSPFRTRLEIDASKPHSALNIEDILQQIEEKGFAIHNAKTEITLKK